MISKPVLFSGGCGLKLILIQVMKDFDSYQCSVLL